MFNGTLIVITGAASGIGRAIAIAARHGARVVIVADLSPEPKMTARASPTTRWMR